LINNTGNLNTLRKAKSVVDESASEMVLHQAFDVIFKELGRFYTQYSEFHGINWFQYTQDRNFRRKENI